MSIHSDKEKITDEVLQKQASKVLVYFSLIALGLVFGYSIHGKRINEKTSDSKFDELLSIIKTNYVDSIDLSHIENKAVNNLLGSLDPHSVYISKDELQAANEPLEGNFDGVGIEFFITSDTLRVISVISGGPSEMAGIKANDKIVKINDTLVAGVHLKNSEVVKKLRGPKGSSVKISIQRGSNPKLIPFVLKRNSIHVNSVESAIMLDNKTGYIKINSFGENTYNEFVTELTKLKEKNHIENFVLDLRQNTGGYLEIAVAIADELIDEKKLIVYTQGRSFPKEQYFTEKPGLFEKGKLAVLIDEGSASASEIVAGAVQDLDRGVVIGRRSFGKGLVQNQIMMSDGSAVRLTIAKYYTPSGRNIQKPYKNTSDYESEIEERYKNGEFFDEKKQTTNDTNSYYTLHKRKVKGGGGIYPDYFVALDTAYDVLSYAALRSIVPDFVYSNSELTNQIIHKYPTIVEFSNNFEISNIIMNQFYSYASSQKTSWNKQKTKSFESKLKNAIKSYIAKQYFKTEGFYTIINATDPVVLKAKSIFNNPNYILNNK